MALPGNGVFVVQGEMTILMTAMRRGARWSSHSHQDEDHDSLMKAFLDLKDVLYKVDDLRLLDPVVFLGPFLEVIRSEETTGPVTSLALSAVNKFLSYGLLDPTHSSIASTVENIADAVTHARFVGTDQTSDGVVLMKILQVLRTLMLSPEGASLTNEGVCEIMLSCFRICFESRLSELLRKTAENCLKDIVQLLFMRLPQFTEDFRAVFNMKQLKMRTSSVEQNRTKRSSRSYHNKTEKPLDKKALAPSEQFNEEGSPADTKLSLRTDRLSTTPQTPAGNIVDMQGSISQSTPQSTTETDITTPESNLDKESEGGPPSVESDITINVQSPQDNDVKETEDVSDDTSKLQKEEQTDSYGTASTVALMENGDNREENQEYVNPRGVRFTPQNQDNTHLVPYGLICVRELFRFLISLCNPLDKQNTEVMIHLGLTLLTVAFEVGADSIGKYSLLLSLVKNELSRNLFSLLVTERLSIFAADLQVSFLMFESLRSHLKFQLEFYLTKLIEIIVSDSVKVTYEHKEVALDNIVHLWRIPGLVTELYVNYDCDMYCTNLFEDLTKLLAKNAFPVTTSVYHTHLLSLDALLTVIDSIENHCNWQIEKKSSDDTADEQPVDINLASRLARQKISDNIPTREQLISIKNIKRWLPTGAEHFNHKPKKGIQFLQEHGVLKSEMDPREIVHFLRENPALDKKMIGEYICGRNNMQVLEAFVKTFDFTDMRVDEALRLYLETFRLPGEAPLISLLLEHFADHWHKCNGEPFANADAAFTLAYAVIMLNVDQHNHNVKRQNIPMTADNFKRNLKKVNGGSDFDQDMLDDMYNAVKNEEIVMPAEHTGLVRENYLWKVLLRRGASKDGIYIHVPNGTFDYDLFSLIWGPTVAALSFVYDKSEDANVYRRALSGFEKCAFISAHFGIIKNFDTLIASLCKFTMLNSQQKQVQNVAVQFGSNVKSQLALRTIFGLIHQHGDIVREGWKNILDLIFALYTYKLLPKSFMEAEDFTSPDGKVSLVRETVNFQKTETGLLSSLYSYVLSSENLSQKPPSPEEQECMGIAKRCVKECNLEQVVTDSKFLHSESLQELLKALVELSRGPDGHKSLGLNYDENVTVFFLELLLKIVIQNRDRVMTIWQSVRDHLYTLVMGASSCDYQFLLERSVIGLLRLAIHLMRNEEMSPTILQSLRMLLLLKPDVLFKISRQISFGLYELLKTSAQNIHTETDWSIIFTLLECVGAGAHPPKIVTEDSQGDKGTDSGAKSEGEGPASSEEDLSIDRGYTSDSELSRSPKHTRPQTPPSLTTQSNSGGGWILVGREGDIQPILSRSISNQFSIVHECHLLQHDPQGLVKCCESLAFLVRDVAHITPYNFENCVHCIRTFVEASLNEYNRSKKLPNKDIRRKRVTNRKRAEGQAVHRSHAGSSLDEDDESDSEDLPSGYHQISIQLLDLMHTLHTRTAQIFRWWAEENGEITEYTSLWAQGWCPLLQGIARLCCDSRRQVRTSAITYLQRALLVHDLQTLSGPEWEACFNKVLFPLLTKLLEPINPYDMIGVEETRMRAATVLSKVFLHHLTPLLTLPTFPALWLSILNYMDNYMHADKSDLLAEAIPESLKNMLLVMESARVFASNNGPSHLWNITWQRINVFLPKMKDDLFKEHKNDVENKTEKAKPEQEDVTLRPQNVENATRSSIILQPPSSDNRVASPLFAHLGQMVSTPIGIPNSESYPSFTQHENKQPASPLASQPHVFPVLYSSPPSTIIPSETQTPVSLYSEYVGNPYNLTQSVSSFKPYVYQASGNQDVSTDSNQNAENAECSEVSHSQTNVFQSSNYFSITNSAENIPPGSEILFGEQNKPAACQDIPVLSDGRRPSS